MFCSGVLVIYADSSFCIEEFEAPDSVMVELCPTVLLVALEPSLLDDVLFL